MALPKDTAAFAILQRSKVKIIPDTKKSGLMHNKFFIVDGKRVWTGSTNLTEHCLFFNPNNAVWIEDARVAEDFLTEFHEEREGRFGRKGSGPANTPYPTVTIGNATVSVYFSPEDSPTPAIVAMIGRAEKTVDVMSFVFSSLPIGEALVAAKKRGVRVRVLLDNAFSSEGATARWKYVPFAELSKAGIACKYDDEQSKLHHKVIVVDSREVLTGSFNLSANAEKTNDENLVIIASADIGARFQAEFDRLWSFFSGDPGKAPAPDAEDRHLGSAGGKEKE
jgi:phosphatidylserine/phosphatidylglycerophosphate/cardiolipin synthase-like enzyme